MSCCAISWASRTIRCWKAKIVRYLWSIQGEHGGWPLFHGGDFNMSASVKAYYALKICGEHVNAPVMKRAREAILSRGGAKESNVFTLVQLALYGQVPWRAVPVMPVEIMALPRWFPFHLDKVSYWSRTVIVPLLVLMAKRPLARNQRSVDVRELFVTPPEQVKDWYNYNRKGAVGLVLPRRRSRASAHAGLVPEEAARALLSRTP